VINDLMQNGLVTAVAMNGSAAIHDFEVAMGGATSEEVGDVLGSGKFGMVRETAEHMNAAISGTRGTEIGLGEAFGNAIVNGSIPFSVSEHEYPRRSLEEKDSRHRPCCLWAPIPSTRTLPLPAKPWVKAAFTTSACLVP
jgi:hypothetical protein